MPRVQGWWVCALVAAVWACEPIETDDGGVGEAGAPGDMSAGDGGVGDGGAADAGPPMVAFAVPGPVYVGGWARVPVEVPPALGFTYDALTFRVAEGPEGGLISDSRDDRFDPQSPHLMLLGGWLPGAYTLEALHEGAVVGSAPFEITLEWGDADRGPPLWFDGVPEATNPNKAASAWGQPGAQGVQMFNVDPQSGNRHVVILLINYTDAEFPADVAITDALKQEWMDHVVDGVNVGGETRSVGAYYDEVSNGQLTFTAEVHGPIDIGKSYQEMREDGWGDKLPQRAITKAIEQQMVDFSGADSVVFVQPHLVLDPPDPCVPTDDPTEICDGLDNDCDGDIDTQDAELGGAPCGDVACGDGNVDADEECDDGNDVDHDGCTSTCVVRRDYMPWPQASVGKWGPYTLADNGKRNLGFVSMPFDWPTHDGREIYATLSHELGHNLGLGDEYTPDVPGRNIGGWDLMHAESQIPHLTLPQRLKLGWITPDDIFVFNPAGQDEAQVELDAIGEMVAAAGRYLGIQIRKGDGWNYYWEYRLRQPGHIGDHNAGIPQAAPGVLLGTDRVNFPPDESGQNRPPLLKVPVQPNSDGFALQPGDTFTESDPPANELRVTHADGDADRAVVEIAYGTFRPDPSIRPWNPGPWQSPDIAVENPRTLADPDQYANLPLAGTRNTVIATVHNHGNDDAPGVQVDFYVKNYNLGSGENVPRTYLDSVFVDVPAGGSVDARCEDCWGVPDDEGHYCIEVRMPIYQNPMDPTKIEQTEFNNVAQSNYSRFVSDAASPATRRRAVAEVSSLYETPALHVFTARQTEGRFRTYVDHTWARLQPGDLDEVGLMFEYADDLEEMFIERRELPANAVSVDGRVLPPAGLQEEGVDHLTGGVTAEVAGRLKTRVVEAELRQRDAELVAFGIVQTFSNTQWPVDQGPVLVRVEYNGDPDQHRFVTGPVVGDTFAVPLDQGAGQITGAHVWYLGTSVYAPSEATLNP